jgi:protocatechuate 3,4-dioxygenase beta subunit
MALFAQAPACSIEGRVTNLLSGGPVRKARVVVGNQQYQAITDNQGHYAINGIAPGRYQVSVQRSGYLPVYYGARGANRPGKSLLLAAGENRKDVSFQLEPPGVITGHIYDQDGEVLSAPVVLYREVWRDGRKRIDSAGLANADDEGEYRLYGLPAGNYIVATAQMQVRPASPVPTHEIYPATYYPSTEDGASATVIKIGPGGEARDIDIRVRKTVSVSVTGSLVSAALDPGMRFTMFRSDGFPNQQYRFLFPQPGEFAFDGIPPGSYVILARSQTEYARLDVDVGTLDVTGLQLRMAPLLELQGKLKIEGGGKLDLAAFSAALSDGDLLGQPSVARPGEDGSLTWKGLTPGKWMLDCTKLPGAYLKAPAEIEMGVKGHDPIEVVISTQAASVEGRVQAAADPVESATVLLVAGGKVVQHAITDADGKYAIGSIPPGKYRLLALDDMETGSWEDPDVARGFEGKGVAIELGPSEKVAKDLVLNQP